MSASVTVHCDKCGVLLVESRLIFEVRAGRMRAFKHNIDFCERCERLFSNWLKEKPENEFLADRVEQPVGASGVRSLKGKGRVAQHCEDMRDWTDTGNYDG